MNGRRRGKGGERKEERGREERKGKERKGKGNREEERSRTTCISIFLPLEEAVII